MNLGNLTTNININGVKEVLTKLDNLEKKLQEVKTLISEINSCNIEIKINEKPVDDSHDNLY